MTDLDPTTPVPAGLETGSTPPAARPTLAARPSTSNRYHFGMLLGVDDLDTDQAYHRGKHWLHQAWLHGPGVVWGFGVAGHGDGEIRVGPGLAVDARGRELILDQAMCLDLGGWFDTNREDLTIDGDPETAPRFGAHVVVRFVACLDRQVPALRDPCGDPETATAYSRVVETVELDLVAGPPPPAEPSPWPRLLASIGLGDAPEGWEPAGSPADTVRAAAVADAVALVDEATILADERVIGERPVLPRAGDDTALVLAAVGVTLERRAEGWAVSTLTVDQDHRPQLLPTGLIQAVALAGVGARGPTGPRLIDGSLVVADRTITVTATDPLRASAVTATAVTVPGLDAGGWSPLPIAGSPTVADDGVTVTVALDPDGPATTDFELVRLTVRGTGPTPVLGDDLRPLMGRTGTIHPPGSDGADAVLDHRS
ncbi:MAG: hypothetical protein ACK5PP_19815 [Acidimicrobiales bacterium]